MGSKSPSCLGLGYICKKIRAEIIPPCRVRELRGQYPGIRGRVDDSDGGQGPRTDGLKAAQAVQDP
jgi:hypothetical protein